MLDIGMPPSLGLVKAAAAREDDVCTFQKLLLSGQQFGGSVSKRGEFVHAVIDRAVRHEMVRKRKHHRRVIPTNECAASLGHCFVEQLGKVNIVLAAHFGIDLGRENDHPGVGAGSRV
jgi:hypothetical protein